MGKTLEEIFGEEALQPAAENEKRRGFELMHGPAAGQGPLSDHPAPLATRRRAPQATAGSLKGSNFLTVPPRPSTPAGYQWQAPQVTHLTSTESNLLPEGVTEIAPGIYKTDLTPEQVGELTSEKVETPEQAAQADVEEAARALTPLQPASASQTGTPLPSVAAQDALEQIQDWKASQPAVATQAQDSGHTKLDSYQPGVITPEQVLASMRGTDYFAYVSGPAGTGKTTLARKLLEDHGHGGRMVLCATTGIAAINLGSHAMTINSLLHYFNVEGLLEKHASRELHQRIRQLLQSGLEYILLDEVSMLSAAAVSCLVQAISDVNETASYDADLRQFSHGDQEGDALQLKLIIVGDFAQLPPVEAPYAFESPDWSPFAANTFKLEKVWRQDDQGFVRALQAVRRGKPLDALDTLRGCFVQGIDLQFDGTTIVGQNKQVDVINDRRHQALPGEILSWEATKSGEQHKDWKIVPDRVGFKVGSLVMILMNRPIPKSHPDEQTRYEYVNGDQGIVEGLDIDPPDPNIPNSKEIRYGYRVRLKRTGEVVTVVPVSKEWTEPVRPPIPVDKDYIAKPGETLMFKKDPEDKNKPTQKVITKRLKGAITYMPLRLAYATTVHKSQGLSLDKVQVIISDWTFTKPGMMYVALSRARTLEGLRIVGTERLFMSRCAVDPKIQEFV